MTDKQRMDWMEEQKERDSHWTIEVSRYKKDIWIMSGNWSSDKSKSKRSLREMIDEAIERQNTI